ncbi:MAG: type II secretion system protein, partial [Verrucomicrobiae bacterium]|nr:type II secretion system protein [Verrucomicrobiae bacterium]
MNPPRSIRAFSLVEVLAAVATIGVVATIAYVAVGDISKSSREQKLASDADTLNRALQVYLANGGSVGEASSPAEVISRLKSATGEDTAFRLPGLTSQLVDPRLSVRMQSGKEIQSTDLRVVWNADTQEFEVGRSGQGGVKEFILDDTVAENAPTTAERTATMLYSKDSDWIWDYQDRNPPSASAGPTVVSVTPEVTSPSVPPSAVPGPPASPVGPPLAGT